MRKTSLLISLALASMSASAVDVTATTAVGTVTNQTQKIQKALPDRRDVAGAALTEQLIVIPEPNIELPVIALPEMTIYPD